MNKDSTRNSLVFRYGFSSRKGLAKATAPYGTDDYRNPWFFKYLDDVRMNTCQDGNLAKVYETGERKIVPIVFLHGLCGTRTTYSQSCRDFASHGYMVLTLSHFDGTASYSRKKNGEERYWTSNVPHLDIEYRRSQIKTRKDEVEQLIDDIFTGGFLQDTLNFEANAQLDLERMVISGHSFGGVNAIECAYSDTRIKYLLTLDPWVWIIHEAISGGRFKVTQP
jgi:predicted dienelactone hydrolase